MLIGQCSVFPDPSAVDEKLGEELFEDLERDLSRL
jgi:hypothetical protein